MSTPRPTSEVAVLMRRERIDNRWQPWRWSLADVVPHEPAFGTEPRRLRQDEREELWLFPGFAVELFRDDAEGYHLNLASPAPCWFVMWRMDEDTGTNTPLARPVAVSLSYHDAGRWLDAQETVEQVPAAHEVLEGLPLHSYVYFVHSYYKTPGDTEDVIASADYGVTVPAVVGKDNVLGFQFHPEKSGSVGMAIWDRLAKWLMK